MKKLTGLLLCLLLLGCLVACSDKTPDSTGTSDTQPATDAPAEEIQIRLLENGASAYEIVYPQTPTQAEADAVVSFGESFRSATGVKLEKHDDFLKAGETHDGDTCKVLIGQTNYEASSKAYEELYFQDYRVRIDGTNLVIAAHTAGGYASAIQWLEKNVFANYADGNLVMSGEGISKSPATYEISPCTIGGISMTRYTIVYSGEKFYDLALEVRKNLAEKTGCYLKVVQDTEQEAGEYEILIGDTNRAESAQVEKPAALSWSVRVVNRKLVVKTGGLHSLYKIYDELVNLLTDGVKKLKLDDGYALDGNYYDDPYDVSRAEGSNLRIFTTNLQAQLKNYNNNGDFEFERRLEIFLASLDFYEPTILGLQEACPSWYNGIESSVDPEKWDVLKFKNPNSKTEYVLSTIMYRKDLLTLIDSGMTYYSVYNNARCRCITWAVLRDNASGKEFCFVSTHWDGQDSEKTMQQVAELTAFVNDMAKKYPVFTTGDFNSNEWSKAFKQYLPAIDSVDCMYAAKERVNKEGSWHDWAKNTSSAGSCDHITATSKDTEVLKFETMMYNEQIYGSDHAWLYADIKFK